MSWAQGTAALQTYTLSSEASSGAYKGNEPQHVQLVYSIALAQCVRIPRPVPCALAQHARLPHTGSDHHSEVLLYRRSRYRRSRNTAAFFGRHWV
jgi:hypothetical protein